MARQRKTPAPSKAAGAHSNPDGATLTPSYNLAGFQAQVFANRYGLVIENAAMIAPLALAGAHG